VPERKRYLFVCVNRRPDGVPKGSCAVRSSIEIHAALKAALAEQGLAKTEARTCTSSCLDVCWAGPVIAVEPDGYFYGRVTMEDIPAIVQAVRDGTRVERLVLPKTDYDEATAAKPLPIPMPATIVGGAASSPSGGAASSPSAGGSGAPEKTGER
jgi:(2Fe-2S) ferredoxin